MQETIVAAATANGEGGVGIVRLSGSKAVAVAGRCFVSRRPIGARPRVAEFGRVVLEGEVIDEAIALMFPRPNSYTGEDVVEIQCHGNPLILEKIISFAVKEGARVADPGEFTRRAYLNGRIDLVQAEAVVDLIRAESEIGLKEAYGQAEGRLSGLISELKREVVWAQALIEVGLDFSDEDIDDVGRDEICSRLQKVLAKSETIVDKFVSGGRRERGCVVAIVGPPNAGKSTLLNCFLAEDRAIVSSKAGTTRDSIEGRVFWAGRTVRLVDTAGLRTSVDPVELEGIKRTKQVAQDSDVVLVVVDGSAPLSQPLIDGILSHIECPFVIVVNKMDMVTDRAAVSGQYPDAVFVSGLNSEGIHGLECVVSGILGEAVHGADVGLTRARHVNHLREVASKIRAAVRGIQLQHNDECIAVELRSALSDLGLLLGEDVDDEVLDSIFSEFCIGK